ncbi:MAG TPA: hypothetical protein VIK12_08860 [Pengzhenrongella sp.]
MTELVLALGAGDRLVSDAFFDGPFPVDLTTEGDASGSRRRGGRIARRERLGWFQPKSLPGAHADDVDPPAHRPTGDRVLGAA